MTMPRQIDQTDLGNRFSFHPATADTGAAHDAVRAECMALAFKLIALVPPGREASLSITALEEVMMWANAGIARNQ